MLTAIAPAKINLSLHLTGRREDGYHLLDSLVAFTHRGDRLTVSPAPALSLEVSGPFASHMPDRPDDNLVLKAARRLQTHTGISQGAHIMLEKHLPAGAGLGGGSSDAAMAARLLCRLWNISPDEQTLATWLLPLGADLPVCLYGRPARMQGIGEQLSPAAAPALPVLLVWPGQALATGEVYQQASIPEIHGYSAGDFRNAGNDLQAPAIALCPVIGEVIAALGAQPGCTLARMSGSGSACFGLFATDERAALAAAALSGQYPHWWMMATAIAENEEMPYADAR